MKILPEPLEFQWDEANSEKNYKKHKVTQKEAEETFEDKQKVVYKDVFHSDKEGRYILIGKTKAGKLMYLVFTTRKDFVRIISVRPINKKEVLLYEKAINLT